MRIRGLRALGVACCGLSALVAPCTAQSPADVPASTASSSPAVQASGDVVLFKGGGKLQGVQVLRADSTVVEIMTVPGVPPLSLPRSQVAAIEYDDVNPASPHGAPQAPRNAPSPTVVTGTKLSRELDQKIFAALPDESLHIQDADFVAYLTDLAAKLAIPLDMDATVRALPSEKRTWSAEIEPGASFISLLEQLGKDFPNVQANFHADHIVLSVREGVSQNAVP